jgi:hypothetical protein
LYLNVGTLRGPRRARRARRPPSHILRVFRASSRRPTPVGQQKDQIPLHPNAHPGGSSSGLPAQLPRDDRPIHVDHLTAKPPHDPVHLHPSAHLRIRYRPFPYSGFNCDWFVFRKAIVNILILAAPGVLWGAILLGTCFKVLLGYDELSWYQAFTLGCVLSATDPVAVVALLKDLGASVRFNTLIEGESLLNDGTAMVFFMLFLEMAKGNSSSASDVVFNFIRIGIGGPILGIVIGFITSLWLKRIVRDDVLTANLTFVSCYMCFYIA